MQKAGNISMENIFPSKSLLTTMEPILHAANSKFINLECVWRSRVQWRCRQHFEISKILIAEMTTQ
jgi:hypothetical protein